MKLFTKIYGLFVIAVLVLSGLILFFSFRSIRSNYIEEKTEYLLNLDYVIQLKIAPLLDEKNYVELDSLIKQIGSELKVRLTIIDSSGLVVADSKKDPTQMENHALRPEIVEAKNKGAGSSLRYSSTVQKEMLYVVIPIVKNGSLIAYTRVSLFIQDLDALVNNLTQRIFWVALVFVGVSLIIIWLLSRSFVKPIKQLSRAAERVSKGDFEAKVRIKNRDELKALADSFNSMTGNIKRLFEEISLQRIELDTIISSIREGFFVLDEKGLIVLANEGFCKISGKTDIIGKKYLEVINDAQFDAFISKPLKKRRSYSDEIELNNKYYLCGASYIEPKQELVVIMSDITQLKNLEDIKKDFVTNVSHELRTPLTAIKGFLETLESDITDEEHLQYLSIVSRHTERLINIVQDLLMLSNLEEAGKKIVRDKVNIKLLFDNIMKIFEQRLAEKKLALNLNIEENLPEMMLDAFKIEQMMINLIDNAIKYTDEGEINISVFLNNNKLRIIVRDTGIGIPKDKAERVFERFFTVDKSRSRKLGGTGLGLSIVKHIVILHGGEIKVSEAPVKGAVFTIELPVIR